MAGVDGERHPGQAARRLDRPGQLRLPLAEPAGEVERQLRRRPGDLAGDAEGLLRLGRRGDPALAQDPAEIAAAGVERQVEHRLRTEVADRAGEFHRRAGIVADTGLPHRQRPRLELGGQHQIAALLAGDGELADPEVEVEVDPRIGGAGAGRCRCGGAGGPGPGARRGLQPGIEVEPVDDDPGADRRPAARRRQAQRGAAGRLGGIDRRRQVRDLDQGWGRLDARLQRSPAETVGGQALGHRPVGGEEPAEAARIDLQAAVELRLALDRRQRPRQGDRRRTRQFGAGALERQLAVRQPRHELRLPDRLSLRHHRIDREVDPGRDAGRQGEAAAGRSRAARRCRRGCGGRCGRRRRDGLAPLVDVEAGRGQGRLDRRPAVASGGRGDTAREGRVVDPERDRIGLGTVAFEAEGHVGGERLRGPDGGAGERGCEAGQALGLDLDVALDASRRPLRPQRRRDHGTGLGLLQAERDADRRRRGRVEPPGLGVEGRRPAADHHLAGGAERTLQALRRRTDRDPLDPLDAPLAVAPDDGAVLDHDVGEADGQPGARRRSTRAGRGRRRRRRGAAGLHRPVAGPVRQGLEFDHRLDQGHPGRVDAAGQQRPERDVDLERLQGRHVGDGGAGRVGKAHVADAELRERQDAEPDVAADGEPPAGRRLRLGRDAGLVLVPVDEGRHHQGGPEQQCDDGDNADEDPAHRSPVLRWATGPARLAAGSGIF